MGGAGVWNAMMRTGPEVGGGRGAMFEYGIKRVFDPWRLLVATLTCVLCSPENAGEEQTQTRRDLGPGRGAAPLMTPPPPCRAVLAQCSARVPRSGCRGASSCPVFPHSSPPFGVEGKHHLQHPGTGSSLFTGTPCSSPKGELKYPGEST